MTTQVSNLSTLRSKVLASIDRVPKRYYACYHVCASYAQLAGLIALIHVLPAGWISKVLYFLCMGWTQYRLYFPLHEACHFSLFRSPFANQLIGRITAGLLMTSFSSFTQVHMQHHRLVGQQDDPGAVDYYVRFATRFEMLRFFLWPLLGLSVFEKVWTNVLRPALQKLRREKHRRDTKSTISLVDLVFISGIQAAVFLALTRLGERPLDYVVFYVLPEATVFLFLARLRMYLEHGPVDYRVSDYLGSNQRLIARTHRSTLLECPLFSYMNFRFHYEHHLVPSLPSCHLPEVHQRFTRQFLDPDDYSPSYLATIRKLFHITQLTPLANPGAVRGGRAFQLRASPPEGDGPTA